MGPTILINPMFLELIKSKRGANKLLFILIRFIAEKGRAFSQPSGF